MATDHRRSDRVAAAFREEVATFLAEDAKDPRLTGLVTVTGSESDRSSTFEGLASAAVHLRSRVGRALRLRLAPEIVFRPDESVAHAARIEDLLAKIKHAQPPGDGDAG